jgi:hypothetical protein
VRGAHAEVLADQLDRAVELVVDAIGRETIQQRVPVRV